MENELYLNIASEGGGSTIYKIIETDGTFYFTDQHSEIEVKNESDDEVIHSEKKYPDFESYWNKFIKYEHWYCLYALFIHDEIKPIIKKNIELKQSEFKQKEKKTAFDEISDSWYRCLGFDKNS